MQDQAIMMGATHQEGGARAMEHEMKTLMHALDGPGRPGKA